MWPLRGGRGVDIIGGGELDDIDWKELILMNWGVAPGERWGWEALS